MADAEPTLTLTFDGEVPLDKFAFALGHFDELVALLTKEVSAGDLDWVVKDLKAGSATITIRGPADAEASVARVGRAYTVLGRALAHGEPIPYSDRIAKEAREITSVLNGRITAVRFASQDEVATVTSGPPRPGRSQVESFGSILGRIETLSRRGRLSFTLYDVLHDQAVVCSLRQEDANLVRDAWGKRALVQGTLRRDVKSGRPIAINPVRSIEIFEDAPRGSYRLARGASPAIAGGPSPEEAVRMRRDG